MDIRYIPNINRETIDSEMITATKFIVDKLNNRIGRIKSPTISTDIDIPKNRAIHINMLNSIDDVDFKSLDPISIMDRDRLLVYNVATVSKPAGKVIVKKKDHTKYEMEMRRSIKKVKIVKAKDSVQLTPKDVMVFNYKLLFTNYTYQQQKLRNYYILRNNLSKLVEEINERGVFDYNVILLNTPIAKIDISKLVRWSKKGVSPSMDSDFKDIDSLLVFEFWKMFFSYADSVFKGIDPDRLNNTYLTLHSNGMYTTYKMLDLLGLSIDNDITGRMKAVRPIEAAKLFLISLNKFRQKTLVSIPTKGVYSTDEGDDDTLPDLDELLVEMGMNPKESDEDDDIDTADEEVDEELLEVLSKPTNIKKLTGTNFIEPSNDTKTILTDSLDEMTRNNIVSKNENAKLAENINEQDNREFIINGKPTKLHELLDYSSVDTTNRYIPLKDSDTIIDKTMLSNSNRNLDKEYLDKLYYKDLYNAIYSIQNGRIVITDHTVEYNKTFMGDVETHTLHLKPLNGKPSIVRFPIPVINKETETFSISSNRYLLRIQRLDSPIRKTSPTTVLLTSYYGKLFIEKNIYQRNKPSIWFAKHIATNDRFSNLIIKASLPYDLKLPKAYTLISGGVTRFTYDGRIDFMFDYKNRLSLVEVSEQKKVLELEKREDLILIGRNKERTTKYYMDKDGMIVGESRGVLKNKGDLEGYFNLDLRDMPVETANIKILGVVVPLGIILLFYLGLDGLVKLLGKKNPFRFYPYEDKYRYTRDEYIIKLKDGILVFDRKDTKTGLIFYGIPADVIKGMSYADLNNKDAVTTMFNVYELPVSHINAIIDLETLYLDNITKDRLRLMNEPTDMHRLLIRAVELLMDDNYKNPNNITENELVRYERIPGLVYRSLSRAVQTFNNKNTLTKARINLDPYEIWRNIGDDSTSMLIDDNNPISMIKQRDNVTYLGAFGRVKETMTIASRAMNPDEVGIISEASPDSGDSGISTYLTHSAEIGNIRGMVNTIDVSKYTINKALSTANILNPFIINDSSNRINFASIQSSHVIPMRTMKSNRILTGGESVVANKVGLPFVHIAEANGRVVKVIKDNKIEVEYNSPKPENVVLLVSDVKDDVFIRNVYDAIIDKGYIVTTEPNNEKIKYRVYLGKGRVGNDYIAIKENKFILAGLKDIKTADTIKTKKSYSLKPWASKVEGNSSIKHTMTTHLKVGDKVRIDEAIGYDSGFFELNIYDPKTIILKMGSYVKLAFIEDKSTYEDSIYFNKKILPNIGEVTYKILSKVVDTKAHITNVLPEGTVVKYGMKLMTIIDSELASNVNISDKAREIMSDSIDASPKAKVNGMIDRIDVIYNCDLEDMDPSIRELAEVSNKRFKVEKGTDGRVTHEYSINGNPLRAGEIEIKYYISSIKDGTIGDKFIAIHQLKNTMGSIVDDIATEDGEVLDGVFGNRSVNNRITNSGYLIGTTNRLLEYYTDKAIKAYKGV